MTIKGGFGALLILLCLATVSGRRLLDVQVQAPGTNVNVQTGSPSPPASPAALSSSQGSPSPSPVPCTPVSVQAPYTNVNVQVPCTPSSSPAASPSPSPSPSPSTATVTYSLPAVSVQAPFTNVQVGRKLHNIKVDVAVGKKQGGAVSVEAAVNTGRKLHDTLTKVGDIASVDVKGAAVSVEAAGVSVNTGNRKLQDVNVSVDLQKKPGQSPVVIVDPALIKVDIATIVGVDVKVGRRLNGTPAAAAQGTVREH
ncbi:hypothetical protein OEZ85_009708 [Tetradesmus obliquus]|uniref:Uncharacterized protein n=1 Tax=Tetradesmus obliquus TaxID=3088 RepID=A0ABY8UA50_TETOB|nr:hypothetical protein OEZ85_009708 [Tetradesmus obliquus]